MVYFVSGIDTDAGKTIATGLMARFLQKSGKRVITMKLVQTGNVGYSEDLDKHRELMGQIRFPEDAEGLTAPQIFAFPASPHFAAELEHREVDLVCLHNAIATLADRYEVVLVEGAGGLMVPLTEALYTVDFAAREKLPLIMVASGKLGSLNHALLSLECALARHMSIAGIAYNWYGGADPLIDVDTPRMILQYLKKHDAEAPLVRIPRVAGTIPPDVDFSAIFGKGIAK